MGCWSIATVMFIVARYAPIVWIISEIYVTLGLQSMETCLTTYRTSGASLFLIMFASEGLLLMRILALWHNHRNIKRFLLASYLLIVISMTTCDTLVGSLLESVCTPTSTQGALEVAAKVERLIMGKFVSAALFELRISVTIYHSILLRSNGTRTIGKLASTLSKGSLLYALSLLAISIANIVSFALSVSWQGQGGIVDVFQGVLHGVLASRILFDLRDLRDTVHITNDTNDRHTCLTEYNILWLKILRALHEAIVILKKLTRPLYWSGQPTIFCFRASRAPALETLSANT
ncbi:hypothetical protein EDB19DRAFT_152077 [Suillus lakei]|nr:hypothetical protein EDB19DRAFT_152077 [Suillus lakei]